MKDGERERIILRALLKGVFKEVSPLELGIVASYCLVELDRLQFEWEAYDPSGIVLKNSMGEQKSLKDLLLSEDFDLLGNGRLPARLLICPYDESSPTGVQPPIQHMASERLEPPGTFN